MGVFLSFSIGPPIPNGESDTRGEGEEKKREIHGETGKLVGLAELFETLLFFGR